MQAIIVALSITSFWFFSPESLVLVGNGAGGAVAGIMVLLLFAAVSLFSVSLNGNGIADDQAREKHTSIAKLRFSEIAGLAGIVSTAVFAPTGILVTAGFTFNEVFYYRFPNFAFAYLLLVVVLGLQFLPSKVRINVLTVSVIGCLAGLLLLTVHGLLAKPVGSVPYAAVNGSLSTYLPLLLVFIGMDQVRFILRNDQKMFKQVFFVSVLLLAGWMFVSSRFVESEKLISSTIPYMTAAGRIAGNGGRLIMGVVIISGTIGAVYGLMYVCRSYVCRHLLPHRAQGMDKVVSVMLSMLIGVLMGIGVAGTTELELYIRTSLLLWLISSAMSTLSAALTHVSSRPFQAGITMISGCIILLGSLILFINQKELLKATIFTSSIIAASVLLIIVSNLLAGHNGFQKTKIINNTEV